MLNSYLCGYKVIIWDFDGTIKDSELRKNIAYFKLFEHYISTDSKRMERYLRENIGVSRETKIKGCMDLIGLDLSDENIKKYLDMFAAIACAEVIESEWIEEVKIYIENNYKKQILYIATQTPQHEIEHLLNQIDFIKYFKRVYGGLKSKESCINEIVKNEKVSRSLVAFVGDSYGDSNAAKNCGVDFYKKIHSYNADVINYNKAF